MRLPSSEKGRKINQTQRIFETRYEESPTRIERYRGEARRALVFLRSVPPRQRFESSWLAISMQIGTRAPLCLANGTMNPQKARDVKFCSSSTGITDEVQWATGENRRDVVLRAVVIDSRRKEGTAGGVHATKQSYLILLLG